MAPVSTCRDLCSPYAVALLAYLREGKEATLLQARELGSAAVASGICASQLSAIHHKSITQIVAIMQHSDECKDCMYPRPCEDLYEFLKSLTMADAVAKAGVFFAESMTSFEAYERDLRKSNVALRY